MRVSMSFATALVLVAVAVAVSTAFAAQGRLQLYLVNSGPESSVYNESVTVDGNCDQYFTETALATSPGTGLRRDSPGYAFESTGASKFSYTVAAGNGFKVTPNPNAVILKLWTSSGDGTCSGQTGDQVIDWRVVCNGVCGSDVPLTGVAGQDKPGYQALQVPAGTSRVLANDHAGPDSTVTVSAGDVITLELTADTWSVFLWNAPNGPGVSAVSILRN